MKKMLLKYFGFKGNNHWGIEIRRTVWDTGISNMVEFFPLPTIRFTKDVEQDPLEIEYTADLLWLCFKVSLLYFKFDKCANS